MEFSAAQVVCEKCGKPVRERIETATGRHVYQDCLEDVQAGAAAVMTGGGPAEAVAIRGWLQRVRAWRSRSRP